MTSKSYKIQTLSSEGAGIIKDEGRIIFVPFALPGEEVEIEIISHHKRFVRAKLKKIITPSPSRITAKCPYFTRCGGCQLQHFSYESQVNFKEQMVYDALTRIGKLKFPRFSLFPASRIWEYRRRIDLHLVGSQFGFMDLSNNFLPVQSCDLYGQFPSPLSPTLFKEKESIHLSDLTFFISPQAFLQAHPEQSALLYQNLIDRITEGPILDLYCGIGITSLLLAKKNHCVIGVESNAEAITLARKSAKYNQLKAIFHTSPVERFTFPPTNTIIVNPPRTGLSPQVIEKIKKHKPKHFFYISCNPATLARDLQALSFEITSGAIFDMFPQTVHVETLVQCKAVLHM